MSYNVTVFVISLALFLSALFLSALVMTAAIGGSILTGLVVYANYWSCDPVSDGSVDSPDQISTLFVVQHLSEYYGLPGVFTAGILGAALR